MRLVDEFYTWLIQGPTPDCDEILAAGLACAEPEFFDQIIATLMQRGYVASWTSLIGHYDQLAPDTREKLHANEQHLEAGIEGVLRGGSAEARAAAMSALLHRPFPRLAYLLPRALLEPSRKLREAASEVLARTVDTFLAEQDRRAAREGPGAYLDRRSERVSLRDAATEVLRTFDRHHRVELVEPCIWLASEIGDELWELLENRRSKCGRVVLEQLPAWSNTRVAGFLVMALGHDDWRSPAQHVLRTWKTLPQFVALLRHTQLASRPSLARALGGIRSPEWFLSIDTNLSQIPQHLRPAVPWWICRVAMNEPDRLTCLTRWARCPDGAVQRAVAYALAALGTPAAMHALRLLVGGSGVPAVFARWCLRGAGQPAPTREAPAPGSRTGAAALTSSTADPGDGPSRREAGGTPDSGGGTGARPDDDFVRLWPRLKRAAPAEREELLAAMRRAVQAAPELLLAQVRSPDVRDRMLVLDIAEQTDLVERYPLELRPLCADSSIDVRRRAQALFGMSPAESA
ncbi:MAG: hypothetical protein AB7Q17_09320 [Phycisphaerae bacterium]